MLSYRSPPSSKRNSKGDSLLRSFQKSSAGRRTHTSHTQYTSSSDSLTTIQNSSHKSLSITHEEVNVYEPILSFQEFIIKMTDKMGGSFISFLTFEEYINLILVCRQFKHSLEREYLQAYILEEKLFKTFNLKVENPSLLSRQNLKDMSNALMHSHKVTPVSTDYFLKHGDDQCLNLMYHLHDFQSVKNCPKILEKVYRQPSDYKEVLTSDIKLSYYNEPKQPKRMVLWTCQFNRQSYMDKFYKCKANIVSQFKLNEEFDTKELDYIGFINDEYILIEHSEKEKQFKRDVLRFYLISIEKLLEKSPEVIQNGEIVKQPGTITISQTITDPSITIPFIQLTHSGDNVLLAGDRGKVIKKMVKSKHQYHVYFLLKNQLFWIELDIKTNKWNQLRSIELESGLNFSKIIIQDNITERYIFDDSLNLYKFDQEFKLLSIKNQSRLSQQSVVSTGSNIIDVAKKIPFLSQRLLKKSFEEAEANRGKKIEIQYCFGKFEAKTIKGPQEIEYIICKINDTFHFYSLTIDQPYQFAFNKAFNGNKFSNVLTWDIYNEYIMILDKNMDYTLINLIALLANESIKAILGDKSKSGDLLSIPQDAIQAGIFLNPEKVKIDQDAPLKFFFSYKWATLISFSWYSKPIIEVFKDSVAQYNVRSTLPYKMGKDYLVYDYSEYSNEELAKEFQVELTDQQALNQRVKVQDDKILIRTNSDINIFVDYQVFTDKPTDFKAKLPYPSIKKVEEISTEYKKSIVQQVEEEVRGRKKIVKKFLWKDYAATLDLDSDKPPQFKEYRILDPDESTQRTCEACTTLSTCPDSTISSPKRVQNRNKIFEIVFNSKMEVQKKDLPYFPRKEYQ